MRSHFFSISLLGMALLIPSLLRAQQPAAKPVAPDVSGPGSASRVAPTDSLLLRADRYHAPVTLSAADFRALPHVTVSVHNAHANADETYSGVSLDVLLAKLNVPTELHKDDLMNYLIAAGSDGYTVVLSLAEVEASFHAGQVLVVDARDGKLLEKSGPFQLIVTDDKRPARWVHNLVSITLQSGR